MCPGFWRMRLPGARPETRGSLVSRSLRVCAEPGCPVLTTASRCQRHARRRDRARGTRQDRGYDAVHDRLRARYQADMDAGAGYRCWRCGAAIDPDAWTLGHCDDDRSRYHGPECPSCQYATSGRPPGACPHPSHQEARG